MKSRSVLIKGSTLAGFDVAVARSGADPQWLLASADLSEIYLRQPELYLPLYNFMDLLEITANETERALFGAELGFQQGISVIGSTARLMETSETVGEALQELLAYYMLHTTGVELALETVGDRAVLTGAIKPPVPPVPDQMNGHLCACGVSILRGFLGPDWTPSEVHFAHPKPSHGVERYHELFGENIRFDMPRCANIFDARRLDTPLPDADPAFHEIIQREQDRLAENFAQNRSHQVKAMILNEMAIAPVSVDTVSRELGVSARSLQRQLLASGTSFTELFEDARKQAAEHYLLNSSFSLTEISGLLGFTSLSSFSHFFHRWHDVSPRQWRRNRMAH